MKGALTMSEEKNTVTETKPQKNPQGRPGFISPVVKKALSRLIYLGPTIIDGGLVLKSNSIYSNGLPPDIAQRVGADPNLSKLFVPVEQIKTAMNKLSDADSDLSATSNKVKKDYLSRRKKGAKS